MSKKRRKYAEGTSDVPSGPDDYVRRPDGSQFWSNPNLPFAERQKRAYEAGDALWHSEHEGQRTLPRGKDSR